MLNKDFFYTIEVPVVAEFKDRGSRFIAYAYPVSTVEEAKQYIKQIKKEHGKAAHHCFAYRTGFEEALFRISDDGEPSGTAGRPILGQIDSKQLTNILVVVVRYFGGTLLGVPGLIHAYKTATILALQLTPIVQKPITITYILLFDYTIVNNIMLLVKKYTCSILQQSMQLFCEMKIAVPKKYVTELLIQLAEIKGLEYRQVT